MTWKKQFKLPRNEQEMADTIRDIALTGKWLTATELIDQILTALKGDGGSLDIDGGMSVNAGGNILELFGLSASGKITTGEISIGAAADILGFNLSLGLNYSDNGFEWGKPVSYEVGLNIDRLGIGLTVSVGDFENFNGKLGSASISITLGPALGKEFDGPSKKTFIEAGAIAGVTIVAEVKSEEFLFEEMRQRLFSWITTNARPEISSINPSDLWAEVMSNSLTPFENRLGFAIAKRLSSLDQPISIPADVFGITLHGSYNQELLDKDGARVTSHLLESASVRFDFDRLDNGAILVRSRRINLLDDPAIVEGVEWGSVATRWYLSDTHAAYGLNGDPVRDDGGRAKIWRREDVAFANSSAASPQFSGYDNLLTANGRTKIYSSTFADYQEQKYGSGIRSLSGQTEWQLHNDGEVPFWGNFFRHLNDTFFQYPSASIDADGDAIRVINGPTLDRPSVSSSSLQSDEIVVTANIRRKGSLTVKKSDNSEFQIYDEKIWEDYVKASSSLGNRSPISSAEDILVNIAPLQTKFNVYENDDGVTLRIDKLSNGKIISKESSFNGSGEEIYNNINIKQERWLNERDVIRYDSAGKPVRAEGGGYYDDGDREISNDSVVTTYTSGPLKGITRIKLDKEHAPLGFIQFDQAGAILGNLLGKSLAGNDKVVRVVSSAFFQDGRPDTWRGPEWRRWQFGCQGYQERYRQL